MSSLLEQAIVDASALKEAALKNAENAVLEKYSLEVKDALSTLLEQEGELGAPAAAAPVATPDDSFVADMPLAHEDEELGGPRDDEVIEIDFDDLKARLHSDEEGGIEPEADELLGSEETAEEIFGGMDEPDLGGDMEMAVGEEPAPPLAEEVGISDALVDAIAEELTVDVAARLQGWSSANSAQTQEQQLEAALEEEAASQESQEIIDEKEKNLKLYETQVSELQSELGDLRSLLGEAKDQLNILILENAKLLYQNKALNSASLNERQKTKIVEAVRNANTVEETKVLFETLQSAVGPRRERRNESLREAVSKPTTSMLLGSDRGTRTSTGVDPNMDRMLRLAGLK